MSLESTIDLEKDGKPLAKKKVGTQEPSKLL